MSRLIDADALFNGTMKEEYYGFKAHDEDGRESRESFAYFCAMQRLAEAPTIDAIPVEWLEKRRAGLILTAMVQSNVYGDNSVELCHAVNIVLDMWHKEQEANT